MSANTYGRQVVLPLTNKSGGGVVAGDVVIIDTTNNDAFTTTTSANFTGVIGIAQETIASNATGRVLISGYAALVNVNASVTRGHYGATFTVAKQATDVGTSRAGGTFCQFLTGGTTPDAMVYYADAALGSGMTNPMTTTGDLITSSSGSTPDRIAAVASGKFLASKGTSTEPAWDFPPGHEFDYAEITSPVTINSGSATTDATAATVVAGNAVSYDGSTVVLLEFRTPYVLPTATDGAACVFVLYDGASSIGRLGVVQQNGTTSTAEGIPVHLQRRFTPSNASHTYTIKAFVSVGNATVAAGAGGDGVYFPAFIRITKAT